MKTTKLLKKKQYGMLLILLVFLLNATAVVADDDDDDEGGPFGEDGVKVLGNWAIIFLFLGSGYVILRRGFVYSKKYLTDEEYQSIQQEIANFYKKTKAPMLYIHNITMIVATILAVLHGIYLGKDYQFIGITGWIAAFSMIILSISGIFIWLRFRPIWTYQTTRASIRFVHRQWLFSGIMILGILLHVTVGGDD